MAGLIGTNGDSLEERTYKESAESRLFNSGGTEKERVTQKFQGYEPKNIHNAGEIGLFFRFISNETMSLKGDPSSGGKNCKK
jgi:hypothetical protein